MSFGEVLELIVGFAILGFMLFFIIVVPIQILNQPKSRPRRRRSRSSYKSKSAYGTYGPKDFDYYHTHNKSNFLVYFIENESLNALKIGVGSEGRLLQLLNSYTEKNELSPNIGWKLLRLAVFANYENTYELGKIYAEQAEKKAHYYWRNVLKLPIHLNDFQMGYSKVKNYGDINWTLTKGYTETVEKDKVCEASTWNYVINSFGFIEENNDFMGNTPRELRLLNLEHSKLREPENYESFKLKKVRHYFEKELIPRERKSVEERFWAKVNKSELGCWDWTGAKSNKSYGYGVFQLSDHLTSAHKVAWILEGKEDLGNSLLDNICGNRSCVKPDHWRKSIRTFNLDGKQKVSNFSCVNEGCERPSRAIHKQSLCEPCRQSAKRKRRLSKTVSSYICTGENCINPSRTITKPGLCEKCWQAAYRIERRQNGII